MIMVMIMVMLVMNIKIFKILSKNYLIKILHPDGEKKFDNIIDKWKKTKNKKNCFKKC